MSKFVFLRARADMPWNLKNQAKFLTFTVNLDDKSWEEYDLEAFRVRLNPAYLVMGKETSPTTGRKHFQGFLAFEKKRKGETVLNLIRGTFPLPLSVWLASSKGSPAENKTYCTKEDATPFEFGECPMSKRSDLNDLALQAKAGATEEELIDANPGMFLVHQKGLKAIKNLFAPLRTEPSQLLFLWGPTGSGKTAAAYEAGPDKISRCRISGKRFLQGYSPDKTIVLFDDFNWKTMDPLDFLELTDRYPCTFDVKNGETKFGPKQIIFTSNFDPKTWWEGAPPETLAAIHRRMDEFGVVKYFDRVLGPGVKPPPRLTDFFSRTLPTAATAVAAPSRAKRPSTDSEEEDEEHSQPSQYEADQRALKRTKTVASAAGSVIDLTQ